MHILAALFDVNDNGFDIYDASIAVGLIVSGYLLIHFLGKRADARIERIAKQLDERTDSIQKNANGGYSLPDLHRKVDNYRYEVRSLTERFDEHLDQHDADRRKRP